MLMDMMRAREREGGTAAGPSQIGADDASEIAKARADSAP